MAVVAALVGVGVSPALANGPWISQTAAEAKLTVQARKTTTVLGC
ncbi:MAG: hypothetical protein WCI74_10095 [Actinomycetes bacterium]